VKFAEGLLYEAVAAALGCGTVGDGKGATRYDLRVLVMDQVPYGWPLRPCQATRCTPLYTSLPHFGRLGKNISRKLYKTRNQSGRAGRIWLQLQKSEGNILGALVGVPEVARENNL
jgi:hypothetical protein